MRLVLNWSSTHSCLILVLLLFGHFAVCFTIFCLNFTKFKSVLTNYVDKFINFRSSAYSSAYCNVLCSMCCNFLLSKHNEFETSNTKDENGNRREWKLIYYCGRE